MRTITHSDLRNNSGQILRDAEAGETMLITNRGRTVASIGPAVDPLPELPRVVRPATRKGGPFPLLEGSRPTQEILDELRGEH